FVAAMEVHQQPVLSGLLEQYLVEVNDLPGLVIEEVQLDARSARVAAPLEERAARRRVAKLLGVLPEEDADAMLLAVVDELPQLGVAPAPPEPLDDAVLEAQLARQPAKLLHPLERALAAVHVFPHGPTGFDPLRADTLGEELGVRG